MNIGKKSLVQALSVLQIIKLILVNLVSRILKKKVALFFSDLSFTKILTNCTLDNSLIIFPNTNGMWSNLPGQSSLLCGQAIHVDF